MSRTRKIAPIHPGEVLLEDYMKPAGMSVNRFALELHVPVTRIAEIIWATAASPAILLCDSRATSEPRRSSG